VNTHERPDDGIELELTASPSEEDVRVLDVGLTNFNIASGFGNDRNKLPLAVFLRRNGEVVGGAYGDTHYGWLFLSEFWLDEALRGRGWGRRLIESFEAEGIRRGCSRAWVDTYGFQAPKVYERLGYLEFGRLENFPPGSARHFYWKQLRG
jgi:GNAT superfamily N-acetyltransferase